MKNKLLSIILPVFNEQDNIPVLYKELRENLKKINYEIIFVNDGSNDNSRRIIEGLYRKNPKVKLINFSRNFGHQIAISCGLDYAQGDAAIILDADLQDTPSLIPEMLRKWQKGYDVVYAIRKSRKGESFFKTVTAHFFYILINLMSKTKMPQNVGDFRLVSRKVIDTLKETQEYQRFLRGMISWVGFNQTGIEFERRERFAGRSKYSSVSMLKLAVDALLSFSFFPLRIASFIGITTALGAIIFIFYTLYITTGGQTVKGWSSTIVIILFLGSIQLITIGIIGEYLGRIYEEVKKRPLYVIESTKGLKVPSENKKNAAKKI